MKIGQKSPPQRILIVHHHFFSFNSTDGRLNPKIVSGLNLSLGLVSPVSYNKEIVVLFSNYQNENNHVFDSFTCVTN